MSFFGLDSACGIAGILNAARKAWSHYNSVRVWVSSGEDAMAKGWRRRSRFQSKKFQPYAVAIGQMNMAWNDFHEVLGSLFMEIMAERASNPDLKQVVRGLFRSRIIWGQISSDRQKRLLVLELAKWLGRERQEAFPTLMDDLKFLTKRADSLEEKRNNVIHSPVDEVRNALSDVPYGAIVAASLNARGRKLEGPSKRRDRELLSTIRLYRDYATVLASYARDLINAWQAAERGRRRAWPRRPPLPRLRDED
jgi:hypothetical protein